jgi:hypothetical protein
LIQIKRRKYFFYCKIRRVKNFQFGKLNRGLLRKKFVKNVEDAATRIFADADKSADADLHGFLDFVFDA